MIRRTGLVSFFLTACFISMGATLSPPPKFDFIAESKGWSQLKMDCRWDQKTSGHLVCNFTRANLGPSQAFEFLKMMERAHRKIEKRLGKKIKARSTDLRENFEWVQERYCEGDPKFDPLLTSWFTEKYDDFMTELKAIYSEICEAKGIETQKRALSKRKEFIRTVCEISYEQSIVRFKPTSKKTVFHGVGTPLDHILYLEKPIKLVRQGTRVVLARPTDSPKRAHKKERVSEIFKQLSVRPKPSLPKACRYVLAPRRDEICCPFENRK